MSRYSHYYASLAWLQWETARELWYHMTKLPRLCINFRFHHIGGIILTSRRIFCT